MKDHHVEVIAADNNKCGEGPVWDGAKGRLIWNDLSLSLVFQFAPATKERKTLSTGLMAAGIALNEGGLLVFAGSGGVHLWRGQDDYQTILESFEGEQLFFNDILAAPEGRLYAGTTYWGESGMQKHGKLYLLEPNGSVRVVQDGIEMSNGLGLSPDRKTLYHADTIQRVINAYRVQPDGSLMEKRTFARIDPEDGLPDGLTVDSEGFVWSAQWYGAQVLRLDPDGKIERRVRMPARQISSVAFGGPELRDLYVTSAGEAWPSEYAPPGYDFNASNVGGSLYRVRGDIAGLPEQVARLGVKKSV